MGTTSDDTRVLNAIFERKVVTIDVLSSLLSSSIKTARRRLTLWEAYTSYNKNGRFYTLPGIPQFDGNGLWAYRSVRFSEHGNLRQTASELIRLSKAGLDAAEMSDLLGIPVRSFLSSLRKHTDTRREKLQGRFVYFTAVEQEFIEQRNHRVAMTRITQLPNDIDAILILVETIKNPHLDAEALSVRLRQQSCIVTPKSIMNLFTYHGLTVKKTPEVIS
jgi:hypothetical protein